MLKYPNQDKRSTEVQSALAEEFDFASRLFSFWLLLSKSESVDNCPLSWPVKQVALMLNLQACRQFRSIVELCKVCEAFNANIIARSLFESALAICFVLHPTIAIDAVPGKGKRKFVAKINPKVSLSHDIRADLYRAHAVFQSVELERRVADDPGQRGDPEHARMVAMVEQSIGKEWAYIIKDSRSYSGLSIALLAKVVDTSGHMENWYRKVYHLQSSMVHAADAVRHIKVDSTTGLVGAAMLSDNQEVSGTLWFGIAIFLVALNTLHNAIDFGPDTGEALDRFYSEYAEIALQPSSP